MSEQPIPLIRRVLRGKSSWGNWCKHYTGMQHAQCAAGVCYASVETKVEFDSIRPREKTVYRQHSAHPCFAEESPLTQGCPKQAFPTEQEMAEHDAEMAQHFNATNTAREAIVKHAHGKRSVQGALDCPACKSGTLMYAIAGNGHVRAKCSTAGCVAWIE